MMKISKPVLMNDFTFSHVQFTSLNLVNFKNIKPVYNGNEKILLEFEHPSKAEISSRDWIGIFPRGWTNLQQYVTFEWISQSVISSNSDSNKEDGEFVRRTIVFCPKYHMNCVNQSALYQFVYVGKQIEVLGVSSYFRFDLTCLTDSSLEIECLVPVTGKVCSASVSDLGTLSMTNDISSTSIDSRKLIHTSSVHSLQNLDSDGKLSWSRMNFTDDKKNMCLMKRASILTSGTGDSLDPYSSHSEPVFPMSLPLAQCKKCYQFKRGGEFLRSQQVLQSKVGPCFEEASLFAYNRRMLGNDYFMQDKLKIVMERNKILEERTQEMKKGLERLQGESKRMKMLYYNVNKEKIAYEKFVKDFIKSLEKDSIVRVLYGNTEILVKKVNYVGMEEHPRDKKTSKKELELKAVIGLQEITIKNLINSLQEKAKSVEELNQTLKLAQVFSVAGTESRDLEIGGEESTDEFSNSDITNEYEFSLPKPSPPEEVSQDTDDVLDKIRRKSEIELKNIGITRSLGDNTQPDVEVPNLSIMALDSDKDVPKRPRLVDNVDDCWPIPRNPSRTFKQTLLESNISLTEEETDISKDGLEIDNKISMVENDITRDESIKDGEIDVDTTTCEDYYDACEALSVRSFSPEPETVEVVQRNESLEPLELTKDTKNILEEGLKSFQVEEKQKNKMDEISEQNTTATCSKFNKFTCELSIDFVQKRSYSDQRSGNLICNEAQNNSERNLVAFCQPEIEEQKVCSIERDKSLITLRKSNKCLEIKITKIDPKETPVRSVHQKMVLQFTGCKIDKEENLTEECECLLNANCPEFSGEENTGNVCSEPEFEEDKSPSVAEAKQINEEGKAENTEVDVFSPRTEWNDALENEDAEKGDTSLEEENKEQELQEPPTETLTATDKEMELKDNEYEIPQQCLTSKCDNQISTEDSIKNSKTYQDSLRYEKNLQFLNNKSEGKDRESDDETLKEKPSAILIQSGQSKIISKIVTQYVMGSVSSVYVSSPEKSVSHIELRSDRECDLDIEPYNDNQEDSPVRKNAMEIRVRHSFNMDGKEVRESEVGVTIQYLAEENARLALANKELTRKLKMLTKERARGDVKDIEIYGETAEQRLIRLEKTLENERKEKWKAIEDCEKIRVDFVNCERGISERDEEIEKFKMKLAETQEKMSSLSQRLEDTNTDSDKKLKRESDMEAYKTELMAKREVRQNALAAVSSELQNLRQELETERALRRRLEEGGKLGGNLEALEVLRLENDELKAKVQQSVQEVSSLNSLVATLRSDYQEEKKKHERTSKEKMTLEAENEENIHKLREIEIEKEKMWEDYDKEKIEVNKRTSALKDVIEISRQMLAIRENQVQELKKKLKEIEESVNNSKLADHKGLKEEYEKQLQNIKTLRDLYEERARIMEMERNKLHETITQHTTTIEGQKQEIESLKEKYGTMSDELKNEKYQNDSLERDLRLSIAKSKDFENELTLINNLFTQMLLGPYNTGNETDLDKLTELLQENHDLITELTLRENRSEIASALPKLLLDLITQVDANGQLDVQDQELDTISEQSDSVAEDAVLPILSYKRAVVFEDLNEVEETEVYEENKPPPKANEQMNPAVQEIASNLPKVWRVLMELLSHHTVPDGPPPGDEKQCYKNIETPSGTRSVISVSNTFIRLKDLILEKKALQKELTRLKQLNSHLEIRLDDQEKRLSHVQCELHKTWGIVGRMRAQHQQLHNHERILRYELQEKRVMLSELKQELEYCKEKWERARQKNDESETQWQKLRREFAARKNKSCPSPNLNDSGESGFSDEPNESGEEAENFDADRSNTQSPVERKLSTDEQEKTEEAEPETSSGAVPRAPPDEEKLKLREARLKRLEDQCQLLVKKVDITTSKSNYLSNRLEELHEQYGGPETQNPGPSKTDEASNNLTASEERTAICPKEPREKSARTVEEMLNARSERLKNLEKQCQSLVGKVTNTVQRGKDLSNRLEGIHEEYLNSEKASLERSEAGHRSTTDAEELPGDRGPEEEPPASTEPKEDKKTEE